MVLDLEELPGTYENRVFVGGNYDYIANLREIESYIEEIGFQPILAFNFDIPEDKIYDSDLRLLHNCKYAIFDVTHSAGELMEIDRASRDFQTIVFVVFQVRDKDIKEIPSQISSMITSMGIPMYGYSTFSELKEYIINILNDIEKGPIKALSFVYKMTGQLPQVGPLAMGYFKLFSNFEQMIFQRESSKEDTLERINRGDVSVKNHLLGMDFIREDLQGQDFEGAVLMGSNFEYANLQKSNFMDAALMGANFSHANLTEANMTKAAMMGTYFNDAIMEKTILRDAAIMGAYLRDTRCVDTNFQDAKLMDAKLERANFENANLIEADLTGAILINTNLRGATVRKTFFNKCDLKNANLTNIEFDDDTLNTVLTAYNLNEAKFDPKVLERIKKLLE